MRDILNPDLEVRNDVLKRLKENDGYCPCRLKKDENTKCKCKEFREQTTEGECHCGLFIKVSD